VESFEVLAKVSAISVESAPLKSHLLPVFHVELFHPPNPPKLESFAAVSPKLRSSCGASSLRLISSYVLVPLVFSEAGVTSSD